MSCCEAHLDDFILALNSTYGLAMKAMGHELKTLVETLRVRLAVALRLPDRSTTGGGMTRCGAPA